MGGIYPKGYYTIEIEELEGFLQGLIMNGNYRSYPHRSLMFIYIYPSSYQCLMKMLKGEIPHIAKLHIYKQNNNGKSKLNKTHQ